MIPSLIRWFNERCNGEWEHQNGLDITTTDNPGWLIRIKAELVPIESKDHVIIKIGEYGNDDKPWLEIRVQDGELLASCSSDMIGEVDAHLSSLFWKQ